MTGDELSDEIDALLADTDGPQSRKERKRKEALYAAIMERRKRDVTAFILETLRALPTDDLRKDVMATVTHEFCPHCWRETPNDLHCQCWNDE